MEDVSVAPSGNLSAGSGMSRLDVLFCLAVAVAVLRSGNPAGRVDKTHEA